MKRATSLFALALSIANIATIFVVRPLFASEGDSLSSQDKALFGNHDGFFGVEPYINTGTGPTTTFQPQPTTPGGPQPEPIVNGGDRFSRTRVNATFQYGGYVLETMFQTLLGLEFRGHVGYGASFSPPGETEPTGSKFNVGMQIVSSYALFRWKGALPGRIVFTPGIGFFSDVGNAYTKGYGYANIGGRIVFYPGREFDLRFGYNYLPGVTADIKLREHQFEVGVNNKGLAFGARFHLGRITLGGEATATETTLGAFIGMAL